MKTAENCSGFKLEMSVQTINWHNNKIRIIDQTELPSRLRYIYCCDIKSLYAAIKELKIRGAPAIGIAGAFGVYLAASHSRHNGYLKFMAGLDSAVKYLGSARPTAVNLSWSMRRMLSVVRNNKQRKIEEIKKLLLKEAFQILDEDKKTCRKMADFGVRLIRNNDTILTICNAGALATADFGTALGVIYRAKEQGKNVKVYACETRPLLQGARLTAWELHNQRIDVTLICDNMAATLMQQKKINKVFVGADRIANNGDTANKIGTYNLAVLANFHKIPFYIVAPVSTFDFSIFSGKEIPIELRGHQELTESFFKKRIAPRGIKVYNPAFDITPAKLITSIVTEKGILRKPFKSLKEKLR